MVNLILWIEVSSTWLIITFIISSDLHARKAWYFKQPSSEVPLSHNNKYLIFILPRTPSGRPLNLVRHWTRNLFGIAWNISPQREQPTFVSITRNEPSTIFDLILELLLYSWMGSIPECLKIENKKCIKIKMSECLKLKTHLYPCRSFYTILLSMPTMIIICIQA